MSARKARTAAAKPQSAVKPPSEGLRKGLQSVLAHAQAETRQQLSKALEKREKTGWRLMDILRSDVDTDMFRRIWSLLQSPAEKATGKKKVKQVKDVLLEGGWMAPEEWDEAQKTGEAYDPRLGQVLIESGHITEEQLQDALAQQQRSGQSFWRILVNRGLVAPKQIADARKYGASDLPSRLDEEALKSMLMRTKLVTKEQCEEALHERKGTGQDLFQVLLNSGAADKNQLGQAISKEMGVSYADLKKAKVDREAVNLLPEHLARQHRMLPLTVSDRTVRLAMANPQDLAARELFRMMVNMDVQPVLAFEADIIEALDGFYKAPPSPAEEGKPRSAIERIKARLNSASAVDASTVSMVESVGVINLVASIIEGAINSRATDVHLDPQPDALRVRYRIDGVLYDIMNLSAHLQEGVISRVKVLAGMDITQRRKPQDGHFTLDALERTYDLRVATLPTVLGEKMVLRLLDPERVFQGLRELGFEPHQLELVEKALAEPYGMLLVTGPIGSGKTTTLYAGLSQVDILTQNVVTIEDPVEYQLPGINQVQIDLRVDRTFANMLRAVIRQDANVLMVGEIRDEDTAHVAMRAAMIGHLVLSTMHTNDAVGAVVALRQLGVPSYLIPNALVAVVAQRLIRRLCPDCRKKHKPPKTLLDAAGLTAQKASRITFFKAVGCENCFETGYRGRTGIFEVFRISAELRELVLEGATHAQLFEQARAEGMVTLLEAGLKKIRDGITTLEEVLRVTAG